MNSLGDFLKKSYGRRFEIDTRKTIRVKALEVLYLWWPPTAHVLTSFIFYRADYLITGMGNRDTATHPRTIARLNPSPKNMSDTSIKENPLSTSPESMARLKQNCEACNQNTATTYIGRLAKKKQKIKRTRRKQRSLIVQRDCVHQFWSILRQSGLI